MNIRIHITSRILEEMSYENLPINSYFLFYILFLFL